MILEEYGPDIIHIAGVDNIVADAISRLPMADHDQTGHCTDVQGRMNEMFNIREGHNNNGSPLMLSAVQRIQTIELNRTKSKLKKALQDKESPYNYQQIEGFEIVMYENQIYVPTRLRRRTLEWYHHYLEHPGGDRLADTL